MNIFKRIILPVLIALSLIIVLVACHKDEITVYQAILKTNKIKSVETDTQVSFKFDYENSDEAIMEKLKTVMNNIKLSAKTRYINNKNNGVYKSGSDISVDMGELIMQCSFWQDLNLKADIPVFKQIYKVPTIVKAFVPDEFAGKDYFVMDFASFYEETDLASMDDLVEMVDMAEEINNHFEELIDIYIKNFKPGIKSITKKYCQFSASI